MNPKVWIVRYEYVPKDDTKKIIPEVKIISFYIF